MNELSLDREAFILIQHKTAFAKERDPEIVRNRYVEDEMVPFIKDRFKASWVVSKRDAVFIRRAGAPVIAGDVTSIVGVRAASIGAAHIDYAPVAGPMLAARENQMRDLPIRLYSRLMIIKTWRAVSPPPQDNSLAVCDSSSVPNTDVLAQSFTDKQTGVTWRAPYYNPLHCWYYFPNMTPDELIVSKSYDSEQNCKVIHSGFDNLRASQCKASREYRSPLLRLLRLSVEDHCIERHVAGDKRRVEPTLSAAARLSSRKGASPARTLKDATNPAAPLGRRGN
ncbi:CmcJ/NvfI family oxidoreductase [Bradyrhizobium genosp. SA-3]|uniref:CmcJ/NvfI family oxidoreductase n=1 Tax=Bradyrhizobium genosp. SA-3 TaxID=508868 RepID=UPI001028F4EE|nr:CmcJ/NvfI family oxidoreductase [Bradyrhizobium genosp. SA-3]